MTATLMAFGQTDAFGDPIEFDGTCPDCAGEFQLDTTGRLPEHRRAGGSLDLPRCTGSGALGHDPHRQRYFYVEGVRFL
ncbi:MAG TPA: hypothetical protein VHX38_13610 [Pseudonocardiaceae bacterium]|jgi:hypothetical protein|nr:hypothetical protein [Pseudonocardiaceae bacterium]